LDIKGFKHYSIGRCIGRWQIPKKGLTRLGEKQGKILKTLKIPKKKRPTWVTKGEFKGDLSRRVKMSTQQNIDCLMKSDLAEF